MIKCTASMLILGCVLLYSPVLVFADDAPASSQTDTTSGTTVAQDQTSDQASPPLDVQPVQSPGSAVDSTTITPAATPADSSTDAPTADSLLSTTSPSDQSSVASVGGNTDLTSTTTPTTSDPSADNSGTGSASQNSSTTTENNQTDVSNQNYAQVFNDSFLQADTGENNANYNTGSGIIMTQKAQGDGELVNDLNTNSTNVSGDQGQSTSSAANQNTGSGSDNTSQTNINNQLTVKNVNDANVINRLKANIVSGNNSAGYNTGHGMIATGDADMGINFFSMANTNLFGSQKFYANLQNVYNNYIGNVDLSSELANNSSPLSSVLLNAANNSTGANSSNQAIANVNDQTSVTNENTGKLNNEIDAKAVSGQNKADYNTGTGSIASGKVNSSVNVVNFLNSNVTSGNVLLKTLNVFGDWQGDLRLPAMPVPDLTATTSPSNSSAINSGTGSGSQNSTSANTNDSTSLTNNNSATIENNITMSADSGSNNANYNGGSGIVQVGAVNGQTNEMNVANSNITGNSWFLVVINRFGNWNGTAVGAPSSVTINSTGVSTILTPDQSGINVTNSPTGADSNNSAGVNIDHKTDISNTNQADITNTLNIQAVSGQNEAQWNTGHGYIQTGDVKGVNNVVNFANTNITVGNWVVVVVNIFGNWNGNLVFNTPGGGTQLPVGGSLACPVFNTSSSVGSQNSASSNNNTGANSSNNSNTTTGTSNSSTNNNNADLNNTTSTSSNTGQNSTNYNTGDGTINTGQATAGSSVGNQANTNSTQSGQGSGDTSQNSNNGTTGSGSTNDSSSNTNNNTTSANNNNASVNNNSSGSTNTGQNSSNYNTSSASIDTGWAQAFLNLMNKVDDNTVTIGDLTNAMAQASGVGAGQQTQIPSDSSTQTCPGVTIVVTPSTASLQFGATKTFTAVANDPSGNPVNLQPTFTWNATGGTIDNNGNYTAGTTAGSFAVTATASYGNSGAADITITDPPAVTSGGSSGGGGGFVGGGGGGGGGGGAAVSSANHKKGDYNNDGKVDDLDFSILMSSWGLQRTGLFVADLGGGTVGDQDLSVVMSNWTLGVAINSPPSII